ncbi:MAG: hypothetical protein ABSG67_09905 [Thermoguttaceae bacterium]|jgi:hypothetical protein
MIVNRAQHVILIDGMYLIKFWAAGERVIFVILAVLSPSFVDLANFA